MRMWQIRLELELELEFEYLSFDFFFFTLPFLFCFISDLCVTFLIFTKGSHFDEISMFLSLL